MENSNNNIYGVMILGRHVDISKNLSVAKKYANKHRHNEITKRYNLEYQVEIVEIKINDVWVSTDLNKRLSIYDNGGDTLDRYTIVDNSTKVLKTYQCICSDLNGRGIFTWSVCEKGRFLGKGVALKDLSEELQNKIVDTFKF